MPCLHLCLLSFVDGLCCPKLVKCLYKGVRLIMQTTRERQHVRAHKERDLLIPLADWR